MLEIRNRTPYRVGLHPALDAEGYDLLTVAVKGTFAWKRRGAVVEVAEKQEEFVLADSWNGEPGISSVKVESETSPAKPGTDVVLIGNAVAPKPVKTLDVTLTVGRLRKAVRVFGDRAWHRSALELRISEPLSFSRMPLVYERAFGGLDAESKSWDPRNPVGVGFLADPTKMPEGARLPNLEDPEELIMSPASRPRPASFGVVGRSWEPRARLAGTYDEAYRRDRFPFLPKDFDERHYQSAQPELTSRKPLEGGERVSISGVSESGDVELALPAARIDAVVRISGREMDLAPRIDTVVIEPEKDRLSIVWKATFRTKKAILDLDWVRVSERGRA